MTGAKGDFMTISNNASALVTNQNGLNTTAKSIASGDGDLAKDMTNLVVNEKTAAANIVAIKAQDTMIGSLLDIRA